MLKELLFKSKKEQFKLVGHIQLYENLFGFETVDCWIFELIIVTFDASMTKLYYGGTPY